LLEILLLTRTKQVEYGTNYPQDPPKLLVRKNKGVSDAQVKELQAMVEKAVINR
jgi:hypothetical protein